MLNIIYLSFLFLSPLGLFASSLDLKSFEYLGLKGVTQVSQKKFKGQTNFERVTWQSKDCLMATSSESASGLIFEGPWEINEGSEIRWEWIAEKFPKVDEEKKKTGDDFVGRIYLVFKSGPFPWQVQSLNYVWSQQAEYEDSWKNPFTAKAIMLNVMKRSDEAKRWYTVKRSIMADISKYLGEKYKRIDAIAFMSDADNGSGESQLCLSSLNVY